MRARGGKKFRFKNKLMSLDGSIIDLSASMFDWAKYKRTKGAIKLHLLLNHNGYLPSFAVVTEGKHSEVAGARGLRLEAGTILPIDRGYNDDEWFADMTRDGVFFVTRMKTNTVYRVEQECEIPAQRNILRDQIIRLGSDYLGQHDDGNLADGVRTECRTDLRSAAGHEGYFP